MSNFNSFERSISLLLSSSPQLKQKIKRIYQFVSYYTSKKGEALVSSYPVISVSGDKSETYFGYYDKSPFNKGFELFQVSPIDTTTIPYNAKKKGLNNIVINVSKQGEVVFEAKTRAFNWQQGSKLHWIDEDNIIFNDINDDSEIVCKLANIKTNSIKVLDYPVYDSFKNEFYISIDYKVLSVLRPDYGYFLERPFENIDYQNQNIVYCDFSGNSDILLTIEQVLSKYPIEDGIPRNHHKFNHIMISPTGKSFIFLHRYYDSNKKRVDRLFKYDIASEQLTLLSDSGMISHYCWVSDKKIISYMSHNGKNGYYHISWDSNTVTIEKIEIDGLDSYGDGHPTYIGDNKFITDTYPNKSRMKSLLLVDLDNKNFEVVAQFYEPLKFYGETRCDLHPKWSAENRMIYVDSVHENKRCLYKVGPI